MKLFARSGVDAFNVEGRSYRIGPDGAFDIDHAGDAAYLLEHGQATQQEPERPRACMGCSKLGVEAANQAAEMAKLRAEVADSNAEVAAVNHLLDKANEILSARDETEARLTAERDDARAKLAAAEDAFADHIAALTAPTDGTSAPADGTSAAE